MNSHQTTRAQDPRRGYMLFEVVIGLLALAVVSVTIMQAIVALDRARQSTQRIDLASRELENTLIEYTSSVTYAEANDATAAEVVLPDHVLAELPEAKLTIEVVEQSQPAAKRITGQLTFAGRPQPLSLTTWVFAPVSESPAIDPPASDDPPATDDSSDPQEDQP